MASEGESNMQQKQPQLCSNNRIDDFSSCRRKDDENARTAAAFHPPHSLSFLCELSQMIYCYTYARARSLWRSQSYEKN